MWDAEWTTQGYGMWDAGCTIQDTQCGTWGCQGALGWQGDTCAWQRSWQGAAGPVSNVVQASLSLLAPLWPVLPKLLILKYC